MKKSFYIIPILLLLLIRTSCDYMEPEPFEQQYVVESVLEVNRPLPAVNLFTTLDVDEPFSWGEVGVNGALVEIYLLDETGNVAETYPYEQVGKGVYHATIPARVQAARSYELYVLIPAEGENQILRAHTRVPGEIGIVSAIADTFEYQADLAPFVDVRIPDYPGRSNIIMNRYLAGQPYYNNLTPYYDGIANEDTTVTKNRYFDHAQDLFSTANVPQKNDQTYTITFPWKWFPYYGPYRIIINTLDDNLYDHLRSSNSQLGISTLPMGEIHNAIEHVEGGLGVFGSVAADTVHTFVKQMAEE